MVRVGCRLDRSLVVGKVFGFDDASLGVACWLGCSHCLIDGWVVLLVSV